MFRRQPSSKSTLLEWITWTTNVSLIWLILLVAFASAQETAKKPPKAPRKAPAVGEKSSGPEKQFLIHRRFLQIPVSETSELRNLSITDNGGTEIKSMEARLAAQGQTVSSWVELDVTQWIGSALAVRLATKDQDSSDNVFAQIRQSNSTVIADEGGKQTDEESGADKQADKISFVFQIQPILSEKCYACHGPDAHNEDSMLRLSHRDSAIESGAIVANDADESELIARITSEDPDTMMPPPDSHKAQLSMAEAELIRNWINEGARYEKHWAFTPIVAPRVPTLNSEKTSIAKTSAAAETNFVRNEIDAFVLEKLKDNGLVPNPDSDPARLVRRLAFDLTGLPPHTDLVQRFVEDSSDENWVNIVDQMLASPHYGEHWARHWLDAVRYGDTHGIHIDNYRSIWPYRDWVVNAINQNMPFDQFTIEQIAGDMLPNADISQKVASGYNRCLPTTSEGGSIDAELFVSYANDQTSTTFAVWQGLTVGCAACHDHKFDPLSQKEYYQLTAFFRNSTMKAKDGNQQVPPPSVRVPSPDLQLQRKALRKEAQQLEEALSEMRSETDNLVEQDVTDQEMSETTADAPKLPSLLPTQPAPVWSFGPDQIALGIKSKKIQTSDGPFGPALKLNKNNSLLTDFSAVADPETGSQLSFGGHFRISKNATGEVFSQMYSDQGKRGWELAIVKNEVLIRLVNNARHCAIEAKLDHKAVKDDKWHHLLVTYDGNRPYRQMVVYLDGMPIDYRYSNKSNDRIPSNSSWGTEARLGFGVGDTRNGKESRHSIKTGEVLIADFVVYDSAISEQMVQQTALLFAQHAQAPIEPTAKDVKDSQSQQVDATGSEVEPNKAKPKELTDAQAKGKTKVSEKAKDKEKAKASAKAKAKTKRKIPLAELRLDDLNSIRKKMLSSVTERLKNPDSFDVQLRLKTVESRLRNIDLDSPVSLVMEEKKNSVPKARVLDRGDYASPLEEVGAEVPKMLPALSPTAPRNRLGFAFWLVSPENPLTARVTVNRYWHHFFGTGIVKSNEDFGTTGDQPTHPELLNWLSDDFVREDWDVKRLIRKIVTSSTYRQSQRFSPEKSEADPLNRLLGRGPRSRLDGEQLRDMALINSQLLTDRLGGPPVKPYQPENVWEEVAMVQSDTRFYRQSFGDQLYRRSLYTIWKRTAAPPSMTILNSPNRDTFCVRREKTNTPLQAFVMWNDPQFVEAARNIAQQTLNEGKDFDESIDYISQLFISRKFDAAERTHLRSTFDEAISTFSTHSDRAKALLSVGQSPVDENLEPAKVAAWTLITSQIMNLDEALTH